MGLICVVCLQSLLSDSEPAASIPCGHIFHCTCIKNCLQSSDQCPLCKKKFSRRQIISPLYFSTGDEDDDQNINSTDLQVRAEAIVNENNEYKQRLSDLRRELADIRKAKNDTDSQLNRATKSMRYLKQIRKVAELDDSLASPTSQSYMRHLQQLPVADLLVNMGALEARFKAATKERNEAIKKLSVIRKDNMHLSKKVERLQEKLEDTASSSLQGSKPKRYPNVITLDSEDEEDDQVITNEAPNNNGTEADITPSSTSPLSVELLAQDEQAGSMQEPSRTDRELSMLSDNDIDFAVEEHSITRRNPYNLKRTNSFSNRSMMNDKRARHNSIIIDDQD